ncbi:MAG: GAF domain-containing protein [Candidatus Xenobiia bacterium LiM19]
MDSHDTAKGNNPSIEQKDEGFYRKLFDNSPLGIHLYEINAEGVLIFIGANKAADTMLGISHSDLAGMTITEAFPQLKETEVPAMYVRAAVEGLPWSTEHITYKDQRIEGAFEVKAIQAGQGKAAAFFTEVTRFRKVEEAARLNELRLEGLLALYQKTESNFNEISHFALEDAVRLTQSSIGYVAFANESEDTLTMYAWSDAAMEKCRIEDKALVYPISTTGLWGEAVRQRRPIITNDYSAPSELKKGVPDGHVQIKRHMNVPIFDGDKIVLVAGVGNKEADYDESDSRQLSLLMNGLWHIIKKMQVDVELKAYREQLEDLVAERTAQMETSNRELESFAYTVSHDLRAPLRTIDGFSQVLLEDYLDKLDDTGQDFLTRIRKGAQTMGQLIDSLLHLSRMTRGEMSRETVNLTTMARETAREFDENEPERNVEWVIESGLVVSGDPRLLKTLLQNLLGNAWKFSSKRKDSRIEFGTVTTQHAIERWGIERPVYYIRDNGAGFDMKYYGKLFGVFQRLHRNDEFPGTGVGLASVQRIVHRHGGTIWGESRIDQGATFYFTL